MNKQSWIVACLPAALALLLVACSGGPDSGETQGGAVGPQEIKGATEVVKFDPAALPLSGDPVPGPCVASSVVPGAYRCDPDGVGPVEPCFALSSTRLVCHPDPVAGTYSTLVSPAGLLPSVAPPSPDRAVAFFAELSTGLTCAIRTTPEPVIIGDRAALYDCSEPYTYILDGGQLTFDKNAPAWSAAVITLDPATGDSSGETSAEVRRVWIP
ncbi:MAG: hypothetical protein KIS95_04595 [Anaerolineae bacterium]|uniref:hypothetical protein n=1 Tax=Promineifilum sp. TaxID=2664178 RepID=UPI001E00E6BD|nr:hypothetical protein [Anaerolineales bacterium]MCB8935408.1 hypothetical protein [Promineifilum sp.]MCO5181558.1 hypothetical protein [Promineifilum sp.]MCW5846485.1 hypothetical protein [Anaerolineae bacterium]